MREPLPRLSSGPLRSASSSAPDHQLRNSRGGPSPLATTATSQVFTPTSFAFTPVSPHAASTVETSFETGTTWPSRKPDATPARRNGHGLLAETAFPWAELSSVRLAMPSFCMEQNLQQYRMKVGRRLCANGF